MQLVRLRAGAGVSGGRDGCPGLAEVVMISQGASLDPRATGLRPCQLVVVQAFLADWVGSTDPVVPDPCHCLAVAGPRDGRAAVVDDGRAVSGCSGQILGSVFTSQVQACVCHEPAQGAR